VIAEFAMGPAPGAHPRGTFDRWAGSWLGRLGGRRHKTRRRRAGASPEDK